MDKHKFIRMCPPESPLIMVLLRLRHIGVIETPNNILLCVLKKIRMKNKFHIAKLLTQKIYCIPKPDDDIV